MIAVYLVGIVVTLVGLAYADKHGTMTWECKAFIAVVWPVLPIALLANWMG